MALSLTMIEQDGYEADDLLGALAKQAAQQKVDVLLVTNDKDMMQLVGDGVRVLRPGTGGIKNDVIVDAPKVKEILGVTPEQVVDYMALFGDSIDNIPGAKGIGEKGAAELIVKYGTVENALDHADEVPNKRYREALAAAAGAGADVEAAGADCHGCAGDFGIGEIEAARA